MLNHSFDLVERDAFEAELMGETLRDLLAVDPLKLVQPVDVVFRLG